MQHYNRKERSKTGPIGRNTLRRRRSALECSVIIEEEEEEDCIKNYKILSESKFARHIFLCVSFIPNTTISDLFQLLCYYFST